MPLITFKVQQLSSPGGCLPNENTNVPPLSVSQQQQQQNANAIQQSSQSSIAASAVQSSQSSIEPEYKEYLKDRRNVINYVGLGIDAHLTGNFHSLREEFPGLFFNRALNVAYYTFLGYLV